MPGGIVVGVGVDAVEVERFRQVLARRPRLLQRLFTPAERDEAAARHDPTPGLAARFAAKEAVMKSLSVGLGAFEFVDVEVVRRPGGGGAPGLTLSGRAAGLAAERSVAGWHLSLTHTASVAVAIAVAYA